MLEKLDDANFKYILIEPFLIRIEDSKSRRETSGVINIYLIQGDGQKYCPIKTSEKQSGDWYSYYSHFQLSIFQSSGYRENISSKSISKSIRKTVFEYNIQKQFFLQNSIFDSRFLIINF